MKYLKILIFFLFFLCQFLLAASPLTLVAGQADFQKPELEQEKNSKIQYIINKVKTYQKEKKFEEAEKLLKEALKEFPDKEDQKKLQIELVGVHFWWAENLKERNDYDNAIRHLEMSHAIDKFYRPKNSGLYLNNIAYLYETLGQDIKALDYYKKALEITQAVRDHDGEANILNNLARVYYTSGQKKKALHLLEKALPIWQAVGDQVWVASTLHKIGSVYYTLDQMKEALKYLEKALSVSQSVGYRAGEASALNKIGAVYIALGKKKKGLAYCTKALSIKQEVGDKVGQASTLNNIGTSYSAFGQKQKALDYFKRALTIFRSVGNRTGEATAINNIGGVYYKQGNMFKALKYYEKALAIQQAVGDRSGETNPLNGIGLVYFAFGENQRALSYFEKALSICKAVGNRSEEASTLNNIGLVYFAFGNEKALDYFEKALTTYQSVGNRTGEATAINNIGHVYYKNGQTHKALEYYEKALAIRQEVGDGIGEVNTLNKIGLVYDRLGQKHNALDYFEKALTICKEMENQAEEASILNNIGGVYYTQGNMFRALEFFEKALAIWQAMGSRSQEANILYNIGALYNVLNQNQKALNYFEKALSTQRAVGNRSGEAMLLNSIGFVYYELGQNQNAYEYFEKALKILQDVGDKSVEAATINNIGLVYNAFGQKHKALEYYEKSLHIRESVGDRVGEANSLNNIGCGYYALGQMQKAMEYFEIALPIWEAVANLDGKAETLKNLMFYLIRFKNPQLSIYYGKQSVNLYQKLRTNISGLEKEIQISFLKTKSNIYRNLSYFLILEGRLSEAQQVLDMLKEEEFFNFIRRDSSSAETLSTQVDFTEFEKKWLQRYNAVMKKLSAISNEYHLLKFKRSTNDPDKKRIEELELKLKEAQKSYEEFLSHIKAAFEKHEREIKSGKIDPATLAKKANKLQKTLKYLDKTDDGKNAALHYLVYKGRISVILTTPSSQSVKQTEIKEEEFNLVIMNYRNLNLNLGKVRHKIREKVKRGQKLLETPDYTLEKKLTKEKKETEKKLYDAIFKPVDEKLKKYGATNLTISLDGVLRYIPLGALWDGESYLVQRYRISLITPFSLKKIKDEPLKEKKILGLGASLGGQGFAPLPYVGREIRSIVRDEEKGYYGLIKGKAFIDNDFTKDTMVSQLKKKYPLVHISSHFKFSPGDETKNHLLLGDGTIMKLSEIRRMGKLFDNVKLLVLSACQTGVGGNGEEIDGFGELAQQSGAKSVIASLWPVADESTKELMVTFYRILKDGKVTGKIEALRQAQLELAGLDDLLQTDKNIVKQALRQKTKYASSYFWGPFIMIGNWR